jgi:hypothetical protein
MEKEFVPYELALRMKALGFDEPCLSVYTIVEKLRVPTKFSVVNNILNGEYNDDFIPNIKCLAPTFSQAFRWFREKYTIVGEINSYYVDKKWSFNYDIVTIYKEKASDRFNTYEEAELACLEKLIEIIEQKEK